jgi:hypothetical protein
MALPADVQPAPAPRRSSTLALVPDRIFGMLPQDISGDPTLSHGAVRLYGFMAGDWWRGTGECERGHAELARVMGCSEASVGRFAAELLETGKVVVRLRGPGETRAYAPSAWVAHPDSTPVQSLTTPLSDSTSVQSLDSTPVRVRLDTGADQDSTPVQSLTLKREPVKEPETGVPGPAPDMSPEIPGAANAAHMGDPISEREPDLATSSAGDDAVPEPPGEPGATSDAPAAANPDEAARIWADALADLTLTMSRANFENHLAGTIGVSFVDDELTVSVANPLLRETLEQRFLPHILRSLYDVTGSSCRVRLVSPEPAGVDPDCFVLPDDEPPEPEQPRLDPALSDVDNVWRHWKSRVRPNARAFDRQKVKARLKTFSLEEMLLAIDHFAESKWQMKHNGERTIAWFCANDNRIEQNLNMPAHKRTGPERWWGTV